MYHMTVVTISTSENDELIVLECASKQQQKGLFLLPEHLKHQHCPL